MTGGQKACEVILSTQLLDLNEVTELALCHSTPRGLLHTSHSIVNSPLIKLSFSYPIGAPCDKPTSEATLEAAVVIVTIWSARLSTK